MQVDVLITLGVVTTVIGLLAFSRVTPDVVLLGGLTLLMVVPIHVDGQAGSRLLPLVLRQLLWSPRTGEADHAPTATNGPT